MDNDNEFNYSANNNFKQVPHQPKGLGFGSRVFIPFVSGALGACLIGGICFGVPQVRDNIFKVSIKEESETTEKSKSTSSSIPQFDNSSYNAKLIDIAELSDTSVAVAEKVIPSIVGINVTYEVQSFGETGTAEAGASGVIISEDGYIITNNHVIASDSDSYFYQLSEAKSIKVYLYGDAEDNYYEAEVVGRDADTDIAVLKIDADNLPAIEIGDSTNLRPGEFAMSVGNPLGYKWSVSVGVISGMNREIKDGDKEFTTIQTDAAVNSGISGGALVNSKGELIGITFSKPATSGVDGIGFAIPITSAMDVVDELIEDGYVKKPYIGIEGRNVTEELAEKYDSQVGIYVENVLEGTPAEEAGLQVGDIITKIDDEKVDTIQELNSYKAKNYKVGDTVTLTIYRDNKEKKIKLTLGEQPQEEEKTENISSKNESKEPGSLQDYYDSIDEYYRYFYNY